MNLYYWMLQEKLRYGQVQGQLCVNGQWQDGKIVDLGPPVKVTLKGQPGCILVDQHEFDIYWRFADIKSPTNE